jgi:hypothetical protein
MVHVPRYAYADGANALDVVLITQPTLSTSGIVYLTWPNYATTTNGAYKIDSTRDGALISTFTYPTYYNENTWGKLIQLPSNIELGHTYTYRVSYYDYNTGTSGSFIGEVTIIVNSVDTIKSLTAKPVSPYKIALNWIFSGSNIYSAVIERKTGINGKWGEIATVQAGVTSYTDTVDSPNVQYYYRIRAKYSEDYYSTYYPGDDSVSSYSLLDTPGTPG